MVDGEHERHLRRDLYGAVDDDRHRPSGAYGEDGGMGRVDDRRELLDAVHAEIGDTEGTALQVTLLQCAFVGLSHVGPDLIRDRTRRHPFDAAQDRCDQPALGGDGHRDVHRFELPHGLVGPDDIGVGDRPVGDRDRLDHQVVD